MKQTERNFWLDVSLSVTFVSTAVTGIILMAGHSLPSYNRLSGNRPSFLSVKDMTISNR